MPQQIHTIQPSALPKLRLGIDLGGSKIEIIALDPEAQVLHRQRVNTPQGDYEETVRAIVDLVHQTEQKLEQKGSVGLGIPGAESLKTGLIKNANSTVLIGKSLRADLEKRLDRSIRLTNDANCFSLSEATDGAASECHVVFGVILGTGVGGGVVVEKKVLTGINAIAGEWGHNPLFLNQNTDEGSAPPRCYCGRSGCVEAWLSGPALVRDHQHSIAQRHLKQNPPQAIPNAQQIAHAAFVNHDPECIKTLERYAKRLAYALAQVINILDPDAIVLGGGLSNISWLYERVPQLWAPYIFSDQISTQLLAPRFGDSSGVRGAAWLWNTP